MSYTKPFQIDNLEDIMELPDGIDYDGEVYWAICPECGNQQGDMGSNIKCDNCGYGPMPTMDDSLVE